MASSFLGTVLSILPALRYPGSVLDTHGPAVLVQEGEAFQAMYENGGLLSTEDGAMSVLAGSTVGGGTRVNW